MALSGVFSARQVFMASLSCHLFGIVTNEVCILFFFLLVVSVFQVYVICWYLFLFLSAFVSFLSYCQFSPLRFAFFQFCIFFF